MRRWALLAFLALALMGFQMPAFAQPTPVTITGADTVCLNSSGNYSVTPTVGITYFWSVTAPNTVMSTTSSGGTILWNGLGVATLTVTGKDAGGVTQECYDTLQLSLPDCTGQWPSQRQTQNGARTGSADGMMVYPNPASHTVGVSYNFGAASIGENSRRIVVYDMMGRPVYTARVSDAVGNLSIPVDWMAAAVYIVRMEENGRTVHAQRLTVTH